MKLWIRNKPRHQWFTESWQGSLPGTPLKLPSSHHPLHLCPCLNALGMIQSTLHTGPHDPSPQLTNLGASPPASLFQIWLSLIPWENSSRTNGILFSKKGPTQKQFFRSHTQSSLRSKQEILLPPPSSSSFYLWGPHLVDASPTPLCLGFPEWKKGHGNEKYTYEERERNRQTGWAWTGKDFSWLRVTSRNTQCFQSAWFCQGFAAQNCSFSLAHLSFSIIQPFDSPESN